MMKKASYLIAGVEEQMAATLAAADSMFISVGTVDMALRLQTPAELVARLAFKLGEHLVAGLVYVQIVGLQPQIAGKIWPESPMWMILKASAAS